MKYSRRFEQICGSLLIVFMMMGLVYAQWSSAIYASDEFEIIKGGIDGSSHSSGWRRSGLIETADRLDGSPAMDDQWDLLFISEAGTTCNDAELYGIVYAEGFFFISGGNNGTTPNKVYVLNSDGSYFADFDQWSSSSAGWRGLTFDGTYLYGCEENVIHAFDLTGNPVPSMEITIPMYGLQGITYDPLSDNFWAVAAGELYEVDRQGNANYIMLPYIGATGLAFDDAAPDDPWLWIFCNLGPVQTIIKQFDPVYQNLTGVAFNLPLLPGSTSQTSSDLFFSADFDPELFALGGITEAVPVDQIFVLEMYPQSPTVPDVTVDLTYQSGSPIPAMGSSLNFNIAIANSESSPVTFDIWTMATLPNGSEYGPIINVPDFTAPATWSADRDRIQAVPGGAPAGVYTYDAYVGLYPDDVWDEDHFEFEKLAGDGVSQGGGWDCWGENFEVITNQVSSQTPVDFTLMGLYPNPFNPVTTISFDLAEAVKVNVTVYDVAGRQVAVLGDGWRDAGHHEMTFDAVGLPSGIYIYKMIAGKVSTSGKMVLMK